MLKLGYAETDITPDTPCELVGFNRKDGISKGVLASLFAQVSVWESDERGCLITIDSLGFKKDLADALRIMVGSFIGIPKEKVMLCFSHTHAAPNVVTTPGYFEIICKKILSALSIAMRNMEAVQIGYMNADVAIGVNRRDENADIDKRAGVLKVCGRSDGQIKLLCVRVTAHCNVLKSDNLLISSDYFGDIRELLKKEYDCPVMVLQGSAGNVAPKYFNSANTPVDAKGEKYIRTHTALLDMAKEVAEKITQSVCSLATKDVTDFKMYSKELTLRAPVPSSQKAEAISEEAKKCGIDGKAWLKEVERLHDIGLQWQQEKAEVQYFSLDDFCLCGVPYEMMTEFALDAIKKTNNPFFYVNGYTNGCSSYFPTEEEYDRGGYEVYYSMLLYYKYHNRVFPFERESAEKMLAFIIDNAPN